MMRMKGRQLRAWWAAGWLIGLGLLAAQDKPAAGVVAAPVATEPAKLQYEGKPLGLPYRCTDEEIQAFGLSCSVDDPCPVYLELGDVEGVGSTIFLAGNLHNDTTTFFSVLLVSEDGGKTWAEPFARHRFGVIDQIQFIDFQNGWVSGQLLQPTPKDPFFLLTNDGGKTWRRRPLFDDGRAGAIEQFHFDSKSNGALVLDRTKAGDPLAKYEYYESQTGGESWTLREVSGKVIRPKRIPARAVGDWRLRADPVLKAYRVEKQSGGKWQTVASFLIKTAECIPPVPPPPPPSPADGAEATAFTAEQEPVPAPARKSGPPTLKKKQ